MYLDIQILNFRDNPGLEIQLPYFSKSLLMSPLSFLAQGKKSSQI